MWRRHEATTETREVTPYLRTRNGEGRELPRMRGIFETDRVTSSSEHIAPTIKHEPTPFNGAVRLNDRILSVVICLLARPRLNRVTEAIMQNGWLRRIEIDHRP